jgi:hypothetical protein
MRVAAHNGHARLRDAHLRPDDVHNALTRIVQAEQRDAELIAVARERFHLLGRNQVEDGQAAVRRRDVMIHRRQREVGAANLAAREAQTFKRLRRGHFVH